MLVRLLVIGASVLAGGLATLIVREKVFGDDPDTQTLPDHVFHHRYRRPSRAKVDVRPDGKEVQQ